MPYLILLEDGRWEALRPDPSKSEARVLRVADEELAEIQAGDAEASWFAGGRTLFRVGGYGVWLTPQHDTERVADNERYLDRMREAYKQMSPAGRLDRTRQLGGGELPTS